eukprot:12671187-Alexandrium_andersonii.AAC.1
MCRSCSWASCFVTLGQPARARGRRSSAVCGAAACRWYVGGAGRRSRGSVGQELAIGGGQEGANKRESARRAVSC